MKNDCLGVNFRQTGLGWLLLGMLVWSSGCGGGYTPPPPITVAVSPKRAAVTTGQTQTFTPTVTGSSNTSVTWEVDSVAGGSATVGTISAAGVYTPPTSGGMHAVLARSAADTTITASASIAVTDLAGVFTYHNDISRTGANTQEFALSTSTVSINTFGKLFSCPVDGAVYAQPLWVANLSVNGGAHNVVYVATEHDTVYAFDADNSACTNVWGTAKSLLVSGETWVNSIGDTGCGDLSPDIGITGTPVIDPATNTLYVVTKSKNPSTAPATFHQRLHALDLATGAEKAGSPVEVSAQVNGNGGGSTGGKINFDALINAQRSALLLSNDASGKHVIIAGASHCDFGQYHGWVMSYNPANLAQEAVVNVSPNGVLSGIWMAGGGPAADSNGNIYLSTGNGTFNSANSNYGDAIVKLAPPSGGTFAISSFFSPLDQSNLEAVDADLGSGGLVLLPDLAAGPNQHLLVQAGKDGRVWIADRTALGGFSSTANGVVQELPNAVPGGIWGSPAYWNGHIYFGAGSDQGANSPPSDPLRDFSFNTTSGVVSLATTSAKIFSFPGPTPSVSSNGTSAGSGIVWAFDNVSWASNCPSSACQVVYAYDATNLGNKLWDSSQALNNRDRAGGAVKFTVPTVANGKVYVGGQNTLTVYGLLP
jgi:hypothetical protein